MHALTISRKIVFSLLLATPVLIILHSCDVLESDVEPRTPEVEIAGNKLYVIPNGEGYIDLHSMVRSYGTVQLDITGSPRYGDLSEISKGLLKYSPKSGFEGHDFFQFAVRSRNNDLLKYDTVVIIVDPDTTNFPCGIYPKNDFVYGVGSTATIDVLANDTFCDDSTNLVVEIYRPDASFPPYAGTAVVENNKIRYTQGSSFTGTDKIVYRVFDLLDSTKSGIGIVYILPHQVCLFDVRNDSFSFDPEPDSTLADTLILVTDTLDLPVFRNDELCNRPVSSYQFTLISDGDVGSARLSLAGEPRLLYAVPQGAPYQSLTDSLEYQLCHGGRCRTAKVHIRVKD